MLEHFDTSVLELNDDTHIIPESGGVYMYIDNNNGGTYIGKAVNLRLRFKGHKNNKKAKPGSFDYELIRRPGDFDYRILIYGIKDSFTLENIEAMYIQRFSSVQLGYNIRDDQQKITDLSSKNILVEYNKLRDKYLKLHSDYVFLHSEYTERINNSN